jgi:sucrose-6-phosphate hydrolase SacC (GH32 family)
MFNTLKRALLLSAAIMSGLAATAQTPFSVKYDPRVQPVGNIQYFTPAGGNQFVGDCIPFFHNGTYYLYWLLDEGHHSALNGLGGHQWCVSTSTDLKNWKHHPIAIGIDEEWEKSICTGSVAYDGKQFYAFYATRLITEDGGVNEQLSYATSKDGITFTKQTPNPFYTSAPGYSKRNFRDPKVVIDKDGTFHLFVSSDAENYTIAEGRGCLVHLSSKDLKNWQVRKPLLSGQLHVPECPDYFEWNGWYYLIYGQGGDTYYVRSRQPYGPWEYPGSQALLEQWVNVAKTAEFTGNRRIIAGWIPSKNENKDRGGERFGGSVVLREAWQLPNGDLATKFPAEAIPATGSPLVLELTAAENAQKRSNTEVNLTAPGTIAGAFMEGVPRNCRITAEIEPTDNNYEYGFFLCAGDKANDGYKLSFDPNSRTVRLGRDAIIDAVDGLDKTIKVDIVMKDDIIDVCVDGRRCIVNRLPERSVGHLWFYAKQGSVKFRDIKVAPIL